MDALDDPVWIGIETTGYAMLPLLLLDALQSTYHLF